MMTNPVEIRLPPINSLALDVPLQMPQSLQTYHPHQNSIPSHLHGLSSPQLAATVSQNAPLAGSLRTSSLPTPNVANFYNSHSNWPHAVAQPSPYIPSHSGHIPLQNPHQFPGLAEYTHSHVTPAESPMSSRLSGSGSSGHTSPSSFKMQTKDNMQFSAPLVQQRSPSSSPRASAHIPTSANVEILQNESSDPVYSHANTTPSVYAAAEAAKAPESQEAKDATIKRRKKRQCPECHLFFSNLATHKSTHLNPTARPHVCTVCSRGFARPNDLFRHNKCHWKETGTNSGQFKCPFKSEGDGNQCSHVSGIFSRCDTYKNHLKAIHFNYPAGTRKGDRATSAGRCGVCQQQFRTVDEWLTTHIDTHMCEKMKI